MSTRWDYSREKLDYKRTLRTALSATTTTTTTTTLALTSLLTLMMIPTMACWRGVGTASCRRGQCFLPAPTLIGHRSGPRRWSSKPVIRTLQQPRLGLFDFASWIRQPRTNSRTSLFKQSPDGVPLWMSANLASCLISVAGFPMAALIGTAFADHRQCRVRCTSMTTGKVSFLLPFCGTACGIFGRGLEAVVLLGLEEIILSLTREL
jgi:hypothetical protein